MSLVTPCAGVWIEIMDFEKAMSNVAAVTPCAGVWIEILLVLFFMKQLYSHSLCGSVD